MWNNSHIALVGHFFIYRIIWNNSHMALVGHCFINRIMTVLHSMMCGIIVT